MPDISGVAEYFAYRRQRGGLELLAGLSLSPRTNAPLVHWVHNAEKGNGRHPFIRRRHRGAPDCVHSKDTEARRTSCPARLNRRPTVLPYPYTNTPRPEASLLPRLTGPEVFHGRGTEPPERRAASLYCGSQRKQEVARRTPRPQTSSPGGLGLLRFLLFSAPPHSRVVAGGSEFSLS